MLFNSFGFLVLFMPIVHVVARRLRARALLLWLTLASFVFYAFAGHVWFLVPMLFTMLLDFLLAPHIASGAPARRKQLLFVSLCGNLGLLAYFKYATLVAGTLRASLVAAGVPARQLGWTGAFDVILPAGISFYTFQTLSYVIDVYRGTCPPERSFLKFAGFVSFFPHLVAGPLTRHDELIPQLSRIADKGISPRWREGCFLFAVGLCKKTLLADRIAQVVDPLLEGSGPHDLVTAWIALLGYSAQIYFDFSGYSDMAIGLGRLFDIELPQNFNSPYRAADPSDFWRRWHITLSRWLRDYLYISLGGNRCGDRRRKLNLVLTMVIGGLWHGANWTFAAWGLYHGVLLVLFHSVEPRWQSLPGVVQRTLTFAAVCFGWVFFRANDFAQAAGWFHALFGLDGVALGAPRADLPKLGLIIVALTIAQLFPNASSRRDLATIGPARQMALGVACAFAIVFMTYSSRFLYFQF